MLPLAGIAFHITNNSVSVVCINTGLYSVTALGKKYAAGVLWYYLSLSLSVLNLMLSVV